MVENLPAIQETQFQSLGWEMVTQSCSLALENSMDSGSWWATAHGVTKSQTQLSN